jgi:hypothetical protein
MKEKINIIDILVVIAIIFFIFLIAWKVFGSSPTLEMIGAGLSFLFLVLALESRHDTKILKDKIGRLDDIYNLLKERLR